MFDLRITLSVEQFTDLLAAVQAGFADVTAAVREGCVTMSEQSQALLDSMTAIRTQFETLNTTMQTEMAAIAAALQTASDPELRQAAADAVTQLATLQEQMAAMNVTVQGIVP